MTHTYESSYGTVRVSDAERLAEWEETGGKCKLCERTLDYDKARWDHDHRTGRFRGWLCSGCNTRLGRHGDSIEGHLRRIDYLDRKRASDRRVRLIVRGGKLVDIKRDQEKTYDLSWWITSLWTSWILIGTGRTMGELEYFAHDICDLDETLQQVLEKIPDIADYDEWAAFVTAWRLLYPTGEEYSPVGISRYGCASSAEVNRLLRNDPVPTTYGKSKRMRRYLLDRYTAPIDEELAAFHIHLKDNWAMLSLNNKNLSKDKNSWNRWIRAQRERQDSVGDFARAYIHSCELQDISSMSPDQLLDDMEGWGACPRAHVAFEQAMNEWQGLSVT